MSLTEDEILEILRVFEKSDFDEMDLEMPGLKLSLGKGPGKIFDQSTASAHSRPFPLSDQKEQELAEPQINENTHMAPPEETEQIETVSLRAKPTVADEEGLISIKSPVLGSFFRSPKPGAPPFVEVGQLVREDDTVCLIEVMKLFNAVKAGVSGRIVKICAKNTEMVEYQQTLFLVEPVATPLS